MSKKITVIVISVILTITLAACGPDKAAAGELSVYALYPDTYTESLFASYRGGEGTVTAKVEIGVRDPGMKAGDAIKELNTKLISGDGPDVIILDGIDPQGYISSGLLADLSEIAGRGEGFIFGGQAQAEKAYYLPLSFALITAEKAGGSAVDFSDLKSYAGSLKASGLKAGYINDAVTGWYRTEIEPALTENKGISRDELKKFYENVGVLTEVTRFGENARMLSLDPGNLMVDGGGDRAAIYRGELGADVSYITNVFDLQTAYSMRDDGKLDFEYLKADGEFSYIPTCIVAVNANGKNKEAAMEMIEYFLSPQGQEEIAYDRLPVNTAVLRDALENAPETNSVLDGLTYTVRPFSEASIKDIMETAASLRRQCNSDSYLMEIVLLPLEGYINNGEDIDTAVDTAMNKLKIYLAE